MSESGNRLQANGTTSAVPAKNRTIEFAWPTRVTKQNGTS